MHNHPGLDSHPTTDSCSQYPLDSQTTGDLSWNTIPPVWSGGQSYHPKLALVFVNPTYRNQAAAEGWPDEYRAPHIGFKRIWKFLAECGLYPDNVIPMLPEDGKWTQDDASQLYWFAADAGLYITNLVKACRTTSAMPTTTYAREWLPLLQQELAIVRPQYIVTMGGLVSSLVLGKPIMLRAVYHYVMATGSPLICHDTDDSHTPTDVRRPLICHDTDDSHDNPADIVPCYFPSGRGNPAKAREIMTAIA